MRCTGQWLVYVENAVMEKHQQWYILSDGRAELNSAHQHHYSLNLDVTTPYLLSLSCCAHLCLRIPILFFSEIYCVGGKKNDFGRM